MGGADVGVEVGGTQYDVVFREGTCIELFTGCDDANSDFDFPSGVTPSALDAVLALRNAIAGSAFENAPGDIFGCSLDTNNQCLIFTPSAVTNIVFISKKRGLPCAF